MSIDFALDYWRNRSPQFQGGILQSGVWQGRVWEHALTINGPKTETLILNITGGVPNEIDESLAQTLAEQSGLGVATLYGIPNQPLFDRMEDDLIAYTFDRFLETGDATWPLLLPMTRAALCAMDVLPAERFIVSGSSKRGWTTWLTAGSGDSRVAAIVPRVFDNLNVVAQLRHQMQLWGAYSAMIQPYVDHQLQDRVGTPAGQTLVQMVDPFAYRNQIECPVYAMHGLNDAYWTVDAHTLYWDELTMPRAMFAVPHAPHFHGDTILTHPSIAAFCRLIAAGDSLPMFSTDVGSPFTPLPPSHQGVAAPDVASPLSPNPSPLKGEGGIGIPLAPKGRGAGGEGSQADLCKESTGNMGEGLNIGKNPTKQEIWRAKGDNNSFTYSLWELNGPSEKGTAEVTQSYFGDLVISSSVKLN